MSFLIFSSSKLPVRAVLVTAKSVSPLSWSLFGGPWIVFFHQTCFHFQLWKIMLHLCATSRQFHSCRGILHQYLVFRSNCICIHFLLVQSMIPSGYTVWTLDLKFPAMSLCVCWIAVKMLLISPRDLITNPEGRGWVEGMLFHAIACNSLEEKLHCLF